MARPLFTDRADAGRQLADVLARSPRATKPTVVLGLPRGGVPVAAVVAAALDAPLDVVAVRKIGGPRHPELDRRLAGAAEEFVAVATPRDFWAVGQWYARFDQTSDAGVVALLGGAGPRLGMP